MAKRWKRSWNWGDKAALAEAVGISPQYLSDILAGRKKCDAARAHRLAAAAAKLGYKMPAEEWVFEEERASNPLFG